VLAKVVGSGRRRRGRQVSCSHLTRAGWSDVLLIERDELTSGSTWHAAGGMIRATAIPNVGKIQQYTINLYKELEKISAWSCGLHVTGGVMLAGTARSRWIG